MDSKYFWRADRKKNLIPSINKCYTTPYETQQLTIHEVLLIHQYHFKYKKNILNINI